MAIERYSPLSVNRRANGTLNKEQRETYAALDAQDPQQRKHAMEQTDPRYTNPAAPQETPAPAKQTATYVNGSGQPVKGYATVQAEETKPAEQPAEQLSYLDAMKEMYTKIYEEETAANNAAAAAAAANALANIETQIGSLNAGYQQTNKQLYRDLLTAEKNLPQQMAAAGYTGGLSESGRINLRASYGEALAQNERERLGQAANLNSTGAQAKYEAEAAAAQANAAARAQRNQSYLALEQQRQTDLAGKAETMAAVGDFTGYLALGYSQAEVDYLTKLWLAENPTYTDVWRAQHPEDAARLGVAAKRTGGGSYAALAAEAESMSLLGQGYSPEEINAGIEQAVANGEYTQAQAQAERQAMGSYFDALNQMDTEYASKKGLVKPKTDYYSAWERLTRTTSSDRDADIMLGW